MMKKYVIGLSAVISLLFGVRFYIYSINPESTSQEKLIEVKQGLSVEGEGLTNLFSKLANLLSEREKAIEKLIGAQASISSWEQELVNPATKNTNKSDIQTKIRKSQSTIDQLNKQIITLNKNILNIKRTISQKKRGLGRLRAQQFEIDEKAQATKV